MAVLVASAAAMPQLAHAATPPPCDSLRGETLAQNAQARVFRRDGPGGRVFGCVYRSRKVLRVFHPDMGEFCSGFGPLRLRGLEVGFAFESCGGAGTADQIEVRATNLGSRRIDRRTMFPADDHYIAITDMVLRRNASFGVIKQDCAPGQPPDGFCNVQVVRSTRSGTSVLDDAPRIGPRSLRLRDGTMSWRNGESRRSAPLR